MKALLVLEDGRYFPCRSFTGKGETSGEVVFNTSMTGYQEVITDPSYFGQIIVMTYPMIGSYGINFSDMESNFIYASALLIKEYQPYPSNFRSRITLAKYLQHFKTIGLENLDTRALTKHIQRYGSMKGFISTYELKYKSLLTKSEFIPDITDSEMVSKITTSHSYKWDNNIKLINKNIPINNNNWEFKNEKYSIIVIDYGVKFSILRYLILHNFEIIVVPATTSANKIYSMNPDGIVLSNGPGNPISVLYAIKTVQELMLKKIPILGICLGHQILGLALGATTYKLKFGHRGGNQPVKNLITGRVEITSQNHGYAIDPKSINFRYVDITHINLNDNTIEGIKHKNLPFFSVQFHPEGSPGPRDSLYIFNQFISIIKNS